MVQITVRLEEAERDALREYAEKNASTMSRIARKILNDFLEAEKNKEE